MEVNKIFEGKPCNVCGSTARYKFNRSKRCVECKHRADAAAYQQRKARKQIAEQWKQDAEYGHTVSLQPAYFIARGYGVDEAIQASIADAVSQRHGIEAA